MTFESGGLSVRFLGHRPTSYGDQTMRNSILFAGAAALLALGLGMLVAARPLRATPTIQPTTTATATAPTAVDRPPGDATSVKAVTSAPADDTVAEPWLPLDEVVVHPLPAPGGTVDPAHGGTNLVAPPAVQADADLMAVLADACARTEQRNAVAAAALGLGSPATNNLRFRAWTLFVENVARADGELTFELHGSFMAQSDRGFIMIGGKGLAERWRLADDRLALTASVMDERTSVMID